MLVKVKKSSGTQTLLKVGLSLNQLYQLIINYEYNHYVYSLIRNTYVAKEKNFM